jgi:hypothetical protein
MRRALLLSALLPALCAAHAQTRQTDREFDGLRGKVKTVTVEEARYDIVARKSVERARVLSRSVTYDADGNWTQWKDYDDKGRLMRSLAFSFIAGDRVAVSENVELPPDALVLELPARRGPRRPDPRYHYKFKYAYAPDGKRLARAWYYNDGRLYLRQGYRYGAGRRVTTSYDERGRLTDRYEAKPDGRGNEVEVLLRRGDTLGDMMLYKYLEFDAQGNWTKRAMVRGFRDELSGLDFDRLPPWSVEYRTITYH